jgi:hypothetical protein
MKNSEMKIGCLVVSLADINRIAKKSVGIFAGLTAIALCGLALTSTWMNAQPAAAPSAQGKPNRSSPVNVTSIVHDTDTSGSATLLRSDDFNGTGQASYTTVNNVLSQIFGFWYLNLGSQTARSVYLTFSQRVSGASDPLPDMQYYDAEVESRCFDSAGNIVDFLSVNTSNDSCSLRVQLTYGGTSYIFLMTPDSANTPNASTGSATVNCNTLNGTTCTSWTITPYLPCTVGASKCNAEVAALYSVAKSGKETLVGTYYNTYRIDVTNP